MTTAALAEAQSTRPRLGLLQQRLAARAHQRQASLLVQAQQAADAVARRYRGLAAQLAELASRLGLAGLPQIAQALDQALAQARADMAAELERLGRTGYQSAARAVLDALPAEWTPVFAALAAARRQLAAVQEAQIPQPEPEPSRKPPQPPWKLKYEWEQVAQGAIKGKKAQQFVQSLLFPPPRLEDVSRWLSEKPPGGLSWDERLRRWEAATRGAMLTQLTQGLVAGENIDGLRARLEPFTAGLAYRAQRIARTEGCRVAERAGRACYSQMGELLDGLQIVAVMDEWTRPHHAARNGRIYRRGLDGLYRDDAGQLLPDLPDEPNCRCMTIPVLQTPEVLRDSPAAMEAFLTAAGELVPDPASYSDWWRQATERERMIAVGVKRYQAVRDMLASGPAPRAPEWEDFITPQGKLIPVEKLRAESAEERAARRRRVELVLDQRRRAYQAVASTGLPPGRLPH